MIYKIIEKSTGIKKTNPIAEIESPTIKDFCYVDELGILFVYDQCIGLIPVSGDPIVPWRGEEGRKRKEVHECYFDDPCAIDYNPFTRSLYVLEKGGSRVRTLENLSVGVDCLASQEEVVIDVLFSNVDPIGDGKIIFRSPFDIVWTAPSIHRCLIYTDSRLSILAGDGRGRYAVANSLEECSLYNPSDVIAVGRDVLIADLGNFCVRRLSSNGISLFCGNPSKPDFEPRRMALQGNVVYVLSENCIKSFPTSGKNGISIYESENIVDLTAGKNGLLVLEVVK